MAVQNAASEDKARMIDANYQVPQPGCCWAGEAQQLLHFCRWGASGQRCKFSANDRGQQQCRFCA